MAMREMDEVAEAKRQLAIWREEDAIESAADEAEDAIESAVYDAVAQAVLDARVNTEVCAHCCGSITIVTHKDIEDAAIIAQIIGADPGGDLVCVDDCPGHPCGQCVPGCVGAAVGAGRAAVDLYLQTVCAISDDWCSVFHNSKTMRVWRLKLGLRGHKGAKHDDLEASSLLMSGVLPPGFTTEEP
jgi:hypothetical protein